MKKGYKVKVLSDGMLGEITKIIRKNEVPFKVYVKHRLGQKERSFMYYANQLEKI